MNPRKLVRAAIAVGAALWFTRTILLRFERLEANAARRALYAALMAGAKSRAHVPSDAAYFDSLRAFIKATNDVREREQAGLSKPTMKRKKAKSIVDLAGSVKSPVFGVSIEDMNPWRESSAQARLLGLTARVWDDAADAAAWLSTPHFELGGKAPIEAAMTDAGAERVEAILERLIHGIPT